MPFRVEIALKSGYRDAIGEGIKNSVKNSLDIGVDDVRTIKVYTVNATLTDVEKKEIAAGPFSDAIVQLYSVDAPLAAGFDWLVEVGFRPGVTDNEGRTGREAIEDRLGRKLAMDESVHTSMQYLINGKLTRAQVETICKQLLGNELIERFEVVDGRSWLDKSGLGRGHPHGIEAKVPLVRDPHKPRVAEVNLDVPDAELMAISRKGTLALTLDEMKTLRDYFRRPDVLAERRKMGLGPNPTDVELETLAQTWSEHCKHKIFNADIDYLEDGKHSKVDSLFKTYIRGSTDEIAKQADWLVSVFKDNAGVIRFNDDYNLAIKVETHNSPSALDPYGGALTGIVGVNRDPFGTGMGAKLIFTRTSSVLPRRTMTARCRRGSSTRGASMKAWYGASSTAATRAASRRSTAAVVFDDRYLGKPLVYCGTVGIMPADGQRRAVPRERPRCPAT